MNTGLLILKTFESVHQNREVLLKIQAVVEGSTQYGRIPIISNTIISLYSNELPQSLNQYKMYH